MRQSREGFTVIELTIVVTIIAILATAAVPAFISYRDRSYVAAATATIGSIRAALSAFAAGDPHNLYPAAIADYNDLVTLLNPYGASLPTSPGQVGITSVTYVQAGIPAGSDYTLTVTTTVHSDVSGHTLTVTSSGVVQGS
jgi:prepilin-type N-terminal cleavage/methylation domain-containing protein